MFCRFVHCVSLALKSPHGERSIKYVFIVLNYILFLNNLKIFKVVHKIGNKVNSLKMIVVLEEDTKLLNSLHN